MKVRCDYQIKYSGWNYEYILYGDGFFIRSNGDFKIVGSARRALKRLAKKLNIELGSEIT